MCGSERGFRKDAATDGRRAPTARPHLYAGDSCGSGPDVALRSPRVGEGRRPLLPQHRIQRLPRSWLARRCGNGEGESMSLVERSSDAPEQLSRRLEIRNHDKSTDERQKDPRWRSRT
jgi:hypothetical protein